MTAQTLKSFIFFQELIYTESFIEVPTSQSHCEFSRET